MENDCGNDFKINLHESQVAKLGFELVNPGFVCVEVLLPSQPNGVM